MTKDVAFDLIELFSEVINNEIRENGIDEKEISVLTAIQNYLETVLEKEPANDVVDSIAGSLAGIGFEDE